MANDLNKFMCIGRLGRDPELKYSSGGTAVVSISLACGWKTQEKEGVEWVKVVAWKRLAEIIGEYLRKGSQVYIEGRMQTREWEDRDGNKRYTTEIVASSMQMLGNQNNKSNDPGPSEASADVPGDDFNIPF